MTTRDNRASALGIALAFRLALPDPGTLTQPDRQHVAYSYRGIEAAELNTGSIQAHGVVIGTVVTSETVIGTVVTSETVIGVYVISADTIIGTI